MVLTRKTTPRRRQRRRAQPPTELVAALTDKQLAMSRRVAAKINTILDTHVRRGDAARAWVAHVEKVRAHLSKLPESIRVKLPNVDVRIFQRLIDEALEELVVSAEDYVLAAMPPLPDEPRAIVEESIQNLAAARAQTSRLQGRWIDLRERIVPFRADRQKEMI